MTEQLHVAANEIDRLRAELEQERERARELETPTAFAVRNDQGYWVGVWNDREMAEHVISKLPPSGNEAIVPVKALANSEKEPDHD